MSTNINLVSPEDEKKIHLSGKPILAVSGLILIVVFAVLGAVTFLKNKYLADGTEVSAQITQQQSLLNGGKYAEVADFQSRLSLIEKIIEDHTYWDSFLKEMSKYVIPDTKLTSFSGEVDSEKIVVVDIEGTATNLDTASRELILLKNFPDATSMEFKKVGSEEAQAEGQNGISFDASLKIEKQAFQK